MKKVIKSKIFLVIICGIIFTNLRVYAATTYKATDVIYNSSDGTSINVNEALNELYKIKTIGNATSGDIAKNKTAVVQGKLITGNVEVVGDKLEKVLLGSSTGTYDLSTYSGYQNFNDNNFSIEIVSAKGSIWYSGRADSGSVGSGTLTFTKSYNSETGKLSVTSSGNTTLYVTAFGETNADASFGANINVYLYYVK